MDLSPFREHGYQVARGLLDPAVVAEVGRFLAGEAEAATAAMAASLGCAGREQVVEAIDRESRRPDFESIAPDLRMTMSGHFPLQARLSPRLWALPRLPAVRAMLEALFNDTRLFMHMPPVARFVLPGNRHAGVPAHQDVSYNKHMSDFVTVWVPMVTIDEACGGVAIFEGSGAEPEHAMSKRDGFWFKPVPSEKYKRVHFPMNVGDALLLNPRVIHGSMPNHSTRTRISVDYRFFGGADHSTKHVLDMQTWKVIEPGGA